jgi:hypothetical protein
MSVIAQRISLICISIYVLLSAPKIDGSAKGKRARVQRAKESWAQNTPPETRHHCCRRAGS